MNRILIIFSIVAVALVCASAVSASEDVDNLSSVELDEIKLVEIDDIAISDNSDTDKLDEIPTDEFTATEDESDDLWAVHDDFDGAYIDPFNEIKVPMGSAVIDPITAIDSSDEIKVQNNPIIIYNADEVSQDISDFLVDYYSAGFSCQKLSQMLLTNYGIKMTANLIQSHVDMYYPQIVGDVTANDVYKLYGSHTLEEIYVIVNLYNGVVVNDKKTHQIPKVSKDTILEKIYMIKHGEFGDLYSELFIGRDLISVNDGTNNYIIGDIV